MFGQRLRLTWQDTQKIRDRVGLLVTTDVRFSPDARQLVAAGILVPGTDANLKPLPPSLLTL